MVIFVAGINGVGKTTLLQELVQRDQAFVHIKGSSILMEALGLQAGNYSALRTIPDETKDRVFGEIVTRLCNEYRHSSTIILIDAHILNLVHGVVKKVVNEWIKDVDKIILVEADVTTVLGRINKDSAVRNRGLLEGEQGKNIEDEREKMAEYMEHTRSEFISIAERYRLPSLILNNPDSEQSKSIEHISDFCRKS